MKIIADNQPRQYEVTCLVAAVYTDSELRGISQKLQDLVKKHKGEIVSTEDWGKRDMAYAIKKAGRVNAQAFYFHYLVQLNPAQAQAFERDLYLVDEVLRHLVVVAEPTQEKVAKEAA